MKKIVFLLSLHFIFLNAFSQIKIFEDNFETGILTSNWKINTGNWYVENLKKMGLIPIEGENTLALGGRGTGEIVIDIAVENIDPKIPLELRFTYWAHTVGSKGTISIVLLNEKNTVSTINFAPLPQTANWRVFKQQFKVTKGITTIRVKLGAIVVSPTGGPDVYFKTVSLTERN